MVEFESGKQLPPAQIARKMLAKELQDAVVASEKDPKGYIRRKEDTWKSIRQSLAGYVTSLEDGTIDKTNLSFAIMMARNIKRDLMGEQRRQEKVSELSAVIADNASYQEILNSFWGFDDLPLSLQVIELSIVSWLDLAPDTFENSLFAAWRGHQLSDTQLRIALDEIGPLQFEEYWDIWKVVKGEK